MYVNVEKFVPIGQTVAEIWRFTFFFKMAATAILDLFQAFGSSTKIICWSLSRYA